jgi:non-ribosomal peptide synthetase-like protein
MSLALQSDTQNLQQHFFAPTMLHQLFEAQVDKAPDQTAVVCGAVSLTYSELDQAANQLAHYLREMGVGPETCVGFWLPRSTHVYVALLGILKAGGAYVPLDAEYPEERVAYILQDCGIKTVITTGEYVEKLAGFDGRVIRIVMDWPQISAHPTTRLQLEPAEQRSENLCYVIYTSGSTGKPKGVQLEHRNALHLVQTEAARFQVHANDRVYQGFSIAFDASVEELWLAWNSGATLVAATADMVHAGPDLPQILTDAGITVLSCVPTLLSMMEGELPTVRILIVGGEVCSRDLVTRWCQPGRRMFNTYGPTEATVIATWTECHPDQPVTIGEPLPGYSAFIVDEQGRILPPGETGELLLGGAGLARGYVGRDDLNRERFIHMTVDGSAAPVRLYRTGDLARWTADGQLDFLGRADGQVKLRGFRVELSEIDSELLKCPGVLAAAAAVREDTIGVQELIGYIVPRHAAKIDEDQIRATLRQRLPVYMVPVLFEVIEALPTLTSGKVDRKQLPAPRRTTTLQHDLKALRWTPQDDIETHLATAWNEVFSPAIAGPEDDFFMDLGGHSLLAARMVSSLRAHAGLHSVSMLDVYHHPTIHGLAKVLRARQPTASELALAPSSDAAPQRDVHRVSSWQHFVGGTVQLILLYFVIGFFSLQWLAPYLTYTFMMDDEYPLIEAAACALGTLALLYPLMLALSIAIKWIVLGRVKPGRYPIWGPYFLRWWFVEAVRGIVPTNYLTGTPLLNWYYRLMGAKIGENVYLGNDGGAIFDLLSIGDDSCLGADSHFTGSTVADGWLIIGPIEIGKRCFIGTRALLGPETKMGDDSSLEDLSFLPRGNSIPATERWRGSPAHHDEIPGESNIPSLERPNKIRRFGYGLLFAVGVVIFPLLPMAAFFPGMVAMAHLNYQDEYYGYLIYSPLVALSFVILISLEIVAIKWLLLGRVRPGSYPLYHSFYFRKWFVDRTLDLSLDVIGPLYSTLYLAPWYRMLGATIGRRAEISTASFVSPDCLQINTESFVADAASLGAARVQNGVVKIDNIVIGKRTFIGNSALVPVGAKIPDNCLIGCLSSTPVDAMPPNSSWLGSPPFFLPARQTSGQFSEEETFRPTRWLVAQRLFIEFFRITLPSTFFIIVTNVLLSAVLVMHGEVNTWLIIAIFPLLYFKAGLLAALTMVAFKWLLMGRYRPCERPLWSPFVWRTEAVTALLDSFASPFFLDLLAGTPFICWFFRLLGAKIGRRVYLDTTELTEFDLVHIGDDVAINHDCTLQTHLFEDRVMKMSTVEVGGGCHLGSMSLVLYDTKLEPGSSVDDLSLVMKGETLPANTHWAGIPGRRLES